MVGYRHTKKPLVLLRHRGLEMWEVFHLTRKRKVNQAIASAVSFVAYKAAALTDMRRKGRTEIPASGWEKVVLQDRQVRRLQSWQDVAEAVAAGADRIGLKR